MGHRQRSVREYPPIVRWGPRLETCLAGICRPPIDTELVQDLQFFGRAANWSKISGKNDFVLVIVGSYFLKVIWSWSETRTPNRSKISQFFFGFWALTNFGPWIPVDRWTTTKHGWFVAISVLNHSISETKWALYKRL